MPRASRGATQSQGSRYTINSVSRAIQIIEHLATAGEPVRLSELSERVGLHRTTLFHILATLQAHGWVARDPARRYTVGARLPGIASQYLRHLLAFDIGALARPYMESVWRAFDETVHLCVLDRANWAVVDVDYIESTRQLRTAGSIGQPKPLYCTAGGKVFLAYLADQELKAYLATTPLSARTDHTITDERRLREDLAAVRTRGYAIEDREYDRDIFCLAAPVFKAPRQPGAGLVLSFPATRFDLGAVEGIAETLKAVAVQVSEALASRLQQGIPQP